MSSPLVVIGGGGFAREVLDIVEAVNFDRSTTGDEFEVVGIVADPAPDPSRLEPYGVPYLGGVDTLDGMPPAVGYVIAIGAGPVRERIDAQHRDRPCPVLMHPTASAARNVTLGPGTVVCAGVRITNHVTIGRHVHLNLNATVGHDCHLGDYATVSPLVAVSGNVTVGRSATLGTGSSIRERVAIGEGSTVGAGAAVVRDVPPGATVAGVPARPLVRDWPRSRRSGWRSRRTSTTRASSAPGRSSRWP